MLFLCPAHSEPEDRTSTSPLNLNTVSVPVSPFPVTHEVQYNKVTHEVQYKNKQDGKILKKDSQYSSKRSVTFEKSPIDNQKLVGKYQTSYSQFLLCLTLKTAK